MIAKVTNPLTVVAIFAGVAESFATVVLTRLPLEVQQIFVWFVIGFPCLLVLLFFLTLNFNSEALYAPSDFANEENYLRTRGRNIIHLGNELKEEVAQIVKQSPNVSKEQVQSIASKFDSVLHQAALSGREEEILELLGNEGMTASEVAEALGISKKVAEVYLHGLLEKRFVELHIERDLKTRRWVRHKNGSDFFSGLLASS